MKLLRSIIFNTKADIQKSAYIWNMIAGLASALESLLFSIIVTRTTGLSDAGIVTIGFAIGNLMATIGKYGVRTFQVTDVNRKYSFSSYLYARIATIVLMIIVNVVYIIYCFDKKDYTVYKSIAVGMLCTKFVIEALEDVFAGECQKSGRLDASSKIFVFRSINFILIFAISIQLTRNLIFSLSGTLAIVILIEVMMIKLVTSTLKLTLKLEKPEYIWDIIVKCFPLCLSAFSFFYITNASKYAIDTVMSDEVQACYSFIAYPVFAIELLNNFIYQPSLVSLANDWNTKNYDKVRFRIYKQLVIILGLTILALAAGYFFGIPVLSVVFSTNLSTYKHEMLILLFGGGLLAVIGYLSTILITMRGSLVMICGYAVAFVISLFSYTIVITRYGVLGGVILYCLLCFLLALYEYISIAIIFRKKI